MPKISDIDHKSNMSDFINYEKISGIITDIKKSIEEIETNVITVLNNELNNGGLDLYAVNINGVPIFHDKGADVEKNLKEAISICEDSISTIDTNAKKHRKEELEQFIKALDTRISILQNEYEAVVAEERSATYQEKMNVNYESKKQSINSEKSQLETKRSTASVALGKVS